MDLVDEQVKEPSPPRPTPPIPPTQEMIDYEKILSVQAKAAWAAARKVKKEEREQTSAKIPESSASKRVALPFMDVAL